MSELKAEIDLEINKAYCRSLISSKAFAIAWPLDDLWKGLEHLGTVLAPLGDRSSSFLVNIRCLGSSEIGVQK